MDYHLQNVIGTTFLFQTSNQQVASQKGNTFTRQNLAFTVCYAIKHHAVSRNQQVSQALYFPWLTWATQTNHPCPIAKIKQNPLLKGKLQTICMADYLLQKIWHRKQEMSCILWDTCILKKISFPPHTLSALVSTLPLAAPLEQLKKLQLFPRQEENLLLWPGLCQG